MRRIALAGIVCVLILAGIVACRAWRSSNPDILQIGNFLALALTLVVLIWYAHDTNVMARVAQERWMREGVLGTTYSMQLLGGKADAGRTLFQLQNPSTLVVRARVACNFRVNGATVSAGPLYDGRDVWLLFRQQTTQGWFEVQSLVTDAEKTIAEMITETTPANRKVQLTMLLALEFWDELGARRTLPSRHHYFDFERWAWIPELAERNDA